MSSSQASCQYPSQVPRPTLRCGLGERTPQELGSELWRHTNQKDSMEITKSWCFFENCTCGQASDVGATHLPSLVARQEAVLGHRAFATWVAAHLQLHVTATNHLNFSGFSTIFVNLFLAPEGFVLPTHNVGWVGEPDYQYPTLQHRITF